MSKLHEIYLSASFRSPEKNSSLQTIKLYGIPGQELRNGEYSIKDEMNNFCANVIAGKLFHRSLTLNSKFQYLKIWLYDSNVDRGKVGYSLPKTDGHDLLISSNFATSKLKQIFVLDNELEGDALTDWHQDVKDLFQPLFEEFVVMSESLRSLPLLGGVESFISKGIQHYEMKKNLFFDTLIIQID